MQLHKLTAIVGVCGFLSLGAFADTLTFVAQPVSGGGIDYSWFNPANWFTTDSTGSLVPAGRVPLDTEQTIITGAVDLGTSGVRVQGLVETNNATLTNGTLAVENLQLLSGSTVGSAIVNVLTAFTVGGTNCTLQNATLTLFGIASGSFQPVPPAVAAALVLTQGSALQIGGFLSMSDGSQINGRGLPQSKVVIESTGALSSTNSAALRGSANGHLIIDNSGLIRVDGGTLSFSDGIDWQSSAGTGEFRANASSALILFSNVFHVESTVTSLFTGPGTNRWLAGAIVDGVAQVSAPSPGTQLAGPGNLEILGSVAGAGMVHALGTTNQGGVATWSSGTLSLTGLVIDPGANLVISGETGTGRQLAGCVITNLGSCTLWNGEVAFSQGAAFDNLGEAIFAVQGQGVFASTDGSGVFNNAGTLQVLSPGALQFGDTNSTQGPAFNNSGLVDLRSGQLELLAGASSSEFRQTPGTLLWFWGGAYVLNAGTSFTGSNTVRVSQGAAPATWVVNEGVTVPSLELGLNGTLDASGVPAVNAIQIGTLVTHDNGSMSNGTFQVQAFEMLDQSSVALSSIDVAATLTVGGSNCTLAGSTLTLPPGASALLQSAHGVTTATLNLTEGAVLQDGGQLTMTGGSLLAGAGSPQSKLVIQTGGVLECTNSGSIQGTTKAHLLVDNSGTIRADSGTLTLGEGLDWQSSSGAAEFQAAAPGATISFAGIFRGNSGTLSLFTGPGTNRWLGGAVIDGAAQVGALAGMSQLPRAGNLEIAGSVAGTGFVHLLGGLSQPGSVSWSDGALSLNHFDVDAGGTLFIGGGAATSRQLSGCALNNSGSCTFIGGDLVLAQGASINNLAGANLLLKTNVALALAAGMGAATLNNTGTLLQSSAVTLCTVGADFNNSGNVEVKSGTLSFQGAWRQSQGTTIIDAGALLAGTNLTVLGGTITGAGTIDGTLINSGGVVSPGQAVGILSVGSGNDYQQGPLGSLLVELSGLVPASQYDQFVIGGQAALGGQLQLRFLNGFVPTAGETFQVLTCSSQTGKFASIAAPQVAGAVWVARYNGTNVSLTLAGSVQLSRPSLSAGSLIFPVNTTSGIQYAVQASDSLAPANWQTITTFIGDGSTRTVSDPANQGLRFYRVVLE